MASPKHLLKTFVPARVVQSRLHKRVYMNFADKVGLVYFGYVDQRSDEHRLVRGLTMSPQHHDNHYCIGSFQTYDVTVVERTDTITHPGKPSKAHEWIIMTFDLHTSYDLPHVFLGLHSHSETFYAHLFTKFSHLTKVPLGSFDTYDPAFINKYAIYTAPDKLPQAQQLFDKDITKTIAERFGGLTLELADNCLYLYAEHQRPTEALLERMIKYGAWLAESLDSQAKNI